MNIFPGQFYSEQEKACDQVFHAFDELTCWALVFYNTVQKPCIHFSPVIFHICPSFINIWSDLHFFVFVHWFLNCVMHLSHKDHILKQFGFSRTDRVYCPKTLILNMFTSWFFKNCSKTTMEWMARSLFPSLTNPRGISSDLWKCPSPCASLSLPFQLSFDWNEKNFLLSRTIGGRLKI